MDKKPLHLLILEDNPDDAELAVKELERGGFTLEWSRVETEKAFRKALDEKPDLILADYKLPSFSGMAALKMNKQLTPEIPLIIFSGKIGEEVAVECMKSGAIDYVLKDRLFRLGPAVKRALEEAEEHRARKRAEERIKHLNSVLRAIRSVNQLITKEKNRDRLIKTSCDNLIKTRGYYNTWMVLLDENGELITTAESGLGKDFLPMVERLKRRELTECARKALSQSDVVVTENPLSTCTGCPLAKMYAGRGAMTVRLEYGGKAYGLLSVSLPRDFARDEEKQSLFKEVANDIAMALHSIESEEKRKRAEQALLESEGHFRKLFEQSIDAIFIHQSSRIIDVNNRACEMLGYSKNHLLTMAIEDLHPEEDSPESRRKVDTAHRVESILFETQFTKADGTMVDVEVNSRIIDHERKIIQGIARDITERKQAEETNKKLQTQLQQSQKLESIGRLAGGVAHDFNNILTVIIGNAELLSISLGKDNPLQGRVEEISKGGERAASLTRQLLAFSRRQMLQPQVLDLNSVIPNMDKMLRHLIGEDIDLETVLAPDLGSVEADPGQIEQVIMNLAVNARDAMPTGGKLTIETANVDLDKTYASKHIAVKPGPYVMMAISDTGMGMDEETRSNIFEPFFTTKEKGKGTGLGLSTVYGIVKQSGGNIWVYSEPEKGTTLKIYLPRVEKVAETAEKVKATAESLTGSETIMVAEDDKMVRDMARSILQQYGYSVLDAEDGESAIRLSEKYEGDVHLMLTDVVMPGMSGRVLAERLAGKRPKMKVLYMSGYTDNAIVHHGVLGKDMNFLQKPFTVEALAQKVREVLDS